ncbi:MAG: hypothetical protein K1X78_09570 [Verrucomicrobiaceae bacterium]|nr:hypothetical protein [Verrucomicrobiaceae bacterium]
MTEKLDFYDVIGVLIPGTVFLCAGAICYPSLASHLAIPQLPEAFAVIALVSLALLCGHVLQSLASFIEPLIEKTWGGRTSEKAFRSGLGERYLPKESADRIAQALSKAMSVESGLRSKFLFAMQISETAGNSRVARFNALYAHFRVLLVMALVVLLMLIHASMWGALRSWPCSSKLGVCILASVVTALFWNRARQRAIYYVREVLLTAERTLLQRPANS